MGSTYNRFVILILQCTHILCAAIALRRAIPVVRGVAFGAALEKVVSPPQLFVALLQLVHASLQCVDIGCEAVESMLLVVLLNHLKGNKVYIFDQPTTLENN